MTIPLGGFLQQLITNTPLLIITLLTSAVILVNGWTDAPNAIATCVSTRSIRPREAIILAAIFNFLGVLIMTLINSTVAQTIYNMVDFRGNTHDSLVALCAAMFAIVLWATLAWLFGIPTSEPCPDSWYFSCHTLQGGMSGINGSEWIKVIYGLFMSTILGFGMGYIIVRIVQIIFRYKDRRKTRKFL